MPGLNNLHAICSSFLSDAGKYFYGAQGATGDRLPAQIFTFPLKPSFFRPFNDNSAVVPKRFTLRKIKFFGEW
jgi:hypothetical protein